MKLRKFLIAAAALLLSVSGVYAAKNTEPVLPVVQESFTIDKTNRQLGYQLINDGKTVVFIFDNSIYRVQTPLEVYVYGSFNGWQKDKSEQFKLTKTKGNIWTKEVPAELVKIPGNSGFPEWKFYVYAEITKTINVNGEERVSTRRDLIEAATVFKIPGYQQSRNNLILFPGDNPETVIENCKIAERQKKLSDFDLSKPEDVATLTNIRLVPGTTKLYRGYHPYKMSRPNFDTEPVRMEYIKKTMEEDGIQSVITLSGDEKPAKNESMSPLLEKIRENGNQLCVDTHYNTVYYHSNEDEFGQLMGTIIKFIGSHPGPYYIHCRLGTDRTGTTSAVLAALCGADWNSICQDYQKTNNMGLKEFRDYRLLQYSFEKMLGKPMSEVENLQKEISGYFVSKGYVTEEDLQMLQTNLK